MPNPNGYDDFVAASQLPKTDPHDVADKDPRQLAEFAANSQAVLERVRLGLSRQSRVPVQLNPDWLPNHMPAALDLRRVGNALELIARHVEATSGPDEAIIIRLDAVRLGTECRRGGLLIDYMLGTAVEQWSLQNIAKGTNRLSAATCRRAIRVLLETDAASEPLAEVTRRDRNWAWFGSGWWQSWDGTSEFLAGIFEESPSFVFPQGRQRERMKVRHDLLLALARRAFELERNRSPKNNEELVPDFLSVLPVVPAAADR